jgi:hypothetical protein
LVADALGFARREPISDAQFARISLAILEVVF